MDNCWAVLKDVVETVLECEDEVAEFCYMKEPGQMTYRLIRMVREDVEEDSDGPDDGL